jgi:hypothetical protein
VNFNHLLQEINNKKNVNNETHRSQLLGVHSTGRLEQDIFVGWSARRKKVKRPDSLYPISRLAGPIPKSVGRRYVRSSLQALADVSSLPLGF